MLSVLLDLRRGTNVTALVERNRARNSAYPASVDDLDGPVAGEGLWVGRESGSVPSVVCKVERKSSKHNDLVQMSILYC